jgi:hypothetical protein
MLSSLWVASTKPEAELARGQGWEPWQGRGWTLAPRDRGPEADVHRRQGHYLRRRVIGSHTSAAIRASTSPRNAPTTTELRRLRAVVLTAAARVSSFGRSISCATNQLFTWSAMRSSCHSSAKLAASLRSASAAQYHVRCRSGRHEAKTRDQTRWQQVERDAGDEDEHAGSHVPPPFDGVGRRRRASSLAA